MSSSSWPTTGASRAPPPVDRRPWTRSRSESRCCRARRAAPDGWQCPRCRGATAAARRGGLLGAGCVCARSFPIASQRLGRSRSNGARASLRTSISVTGVSPSRCVRHASSSIRPGVNTTGPAAAGRRTLACRRLCCSMTVRRACRNLSARDPLLKRYTCTIGASAIRRGDATPSHAVACHRLWALTPRARKRPSTSAVQPCRTASEPRR